jgi:hypothetical protein
MPGRRHSKNARKKTTNRKPTKKRAAKKTRPTKEYSDFEDVVVRLAMRARAERRAARAMYLRVVEPSTRRPPLERARVWLTYFAENRGDYAGQEAIVYCKSRGIECRYAIDDVLKLWREDAAVAIERSAIHSDLLSDKGVPITSRTGSALPPMVSSFWDYSRETEDTIEATMLRTVEWCAIREFDEWWVRLAEDTHRHLLEGGIENPVAASMRLFALCRSRLAMALMRKTCMHVLRVVSDSPPGLYPQWDVPYSQNRRALHIGCIASVAFALYRLFPGASDATYRLCEMLVDNQREDGSWGWYSLSDHGNMNATAHAMTALQLVQPHKPAVSRALRKAQAWLLGQQHVEGYWDDPSTEPVYLTVLIADVLEAMERGSASPPIVTWDAPQHPLAVSASEPRFRIALSVPGEHRKFIAAVANELARSLGRHRVLYDKYLEAELARPNSDTYLQQLYVATPLIAVLLADEYQTKEWCGLEARVIRTIIKKRQDARIFLLRHGAPSVDGFLSIDGFIQIEGRQPADVAAKIVSRVAEAEKVFREQGVAT